MRILKFSFCLLASILTVVSVRAQAYVADGKPIGIRINGNAYLIGDPGQARIGATGLTGWSSPATEVAVFFHVDRPQRFDLYLKGKNPDAASVVQVMIDGRAYKVPFSVSKDTALVPVGKITVAKPGYVKITLKGISREGAEYAQLFAAVAQGLTGEVCYVNSFSPYWGNRGPSVHLNYTMPAESTEWFYNEVTVPAGEDVEGSYYMADGFGQGYFGMQFNSPVERRVLFSVWSPFNTQDPKSIPEEDKIKLLRTGEGVHTGEFGNEGSGGQSYLRYQWKSGVTYKFLMHIKPDGKGNTVYTAYFFATDENRWRLIASFLRPKTNVYYTHAHSFLENFSPGQGYLTRRVHFGNMFCIGTDGVWREVSEAKFTCDGTGKAKARLDFAGGSESDGFYLQNGGFFDQRTEYGAVFVRQPEKKVPSIDFEVLEKL